MFQDYKVANIYTYGYKNMEVQLTIIDSDFTKDLSKKINSNLYIACKAELFIKCYSELNLDVAHNFYLYILKNINYYGADVEQKLIDNCLKNVPEYLKYHKEIIQYKKRYENQKAFW
jgi:hypothetical protein